MCSAVCRVVTGITRRVYNFLICLGIKALDSVGQTLISLCAGVKQVAPLKCKTFVSMLSIGANACQGREADSELKHF